MIPIFDPDNREPARSGKLVEALRAYNRKRTVCLSAMELLRLIERETGKPFQGEALLQWLEERESVFPDSSCEDSPDCR